MADRLVFSTGAADKARPAGTCRRLLIPARVDLVLTNELGWGRPSKGDPCKAPSQQG
jgi:hypothetical protein